MKVTDTPDQMAARKHDHIRICRDEDVEAQQKVVSNFRLSACAFPEMDVADVETCSTLFAKPFAMPLLITGMTGGVDYGQKINEVLARCAAQFEIPMGLGSQKIMVADASTSALFQLRATAPSAFLIGNMGAVSFNHGITVDDVLRLIERCELNAFALHVNALQECIQPEGERNFKNLFSIIELLVKRLPVPLMVKEVGVGMDAQSAVRLAEVGVKTIDVGGRGGTSWSHIEGRRGDEMTSRLGTLFRDWGRSTEDCVVACHQALREKNLTAQIVATGGVRDGMQVAKLVGLGAAMAGVGLPLFRAAVNAIQEGDVDKAMRDVCTELEFFKRSLTIAMFCSGARDLGELPQRVERTKRTSDEF